MNFNTYAHENGNFGYKMLSDYTWESMVLWLLKTTFLLSNQQKEIKINNNIS